MNARADATRPFSVASSAGSSSSIVDVAVIGGGIVGAAAALASAHAGLSTVWVAGEARSVPAAHASGDWDARVYALSPATCAFLTDLRVWPQLDATRVAPVRDMRIYGDRDGRSSLHFGAYEAGIEALAAIVEHRALARVLDTAASYAPGIERIDGLATNVFADDEAVLFATARGLRRARLVVAADGAHSPTRDALGIEVTTRPYAQKAVIGHFHCARPHGGTAFQWFDDGVIALLPMPDIDGRPAVSLVWSAPDALADELLAEGSAGVATRLSTRVSHRAESAIGPLEAIGPLVSVPLTLQFAARLGAKRGVLVGDSAHVVHPLAGQGLNLGLQDVEVLVELLAAREPFRDCGDPRLVRRYERLRAEPVLAMRGVTDGLTRLFGVDGALPGALRGLGMQLVDRTPPLKRLLMRHASGL